MRIHDTVYHIQRNQVESKLSRNIIGNIFMEFLTKYIFIELITQIIIVSFKGF